MKYIRELLITALLLIVTWTIFDGSRLRNQLSERGRVEEKLRHQVDSIVELQHQAELQALKYGTALNVAKQELARQSETINHQRKRNESLKTVFSVHYVDSAALREIARLTGSH